MARDQYTKLSQDEKKLKEKKKKTRKKQHPYTYKEDIQKLKE